MKFLCPSCKAKYQIADEKVAGRSVRMKCRKCGHMISIAKAVTEGSVSRKLEAGGSERPPPSSTGTGSKPKPAPPPRANPAGWREPASATPPRAAPPPRPGAQRAPSPFAASPPARPAPPPRKEPSPAPPAASGALRSAVRATAAQVSEVKQPPPAPPHATGNGGNGNGSASALAFSAFARDAGLVSYDEDEEQTVIAGVGALGAAFSQAVSGPESSSIISTPADEWYVGINGVPVGPIRLSELRSKAAVGAITLDSLVWREGFEEWQPLRSFPELIAIVEEGLSSARASLSPLSPPAHSHSPIPPAPAPVAGAPAPAVGVLSDPFAAPTSAIGAPPSVERAELPELAVIPPRRGAGAAWIAVVVALLFGLTIGFVLFSRDKGEPIVKIVEVPAKGESNAPATSAAATGGSETEEVEVPGEPGKPGKVAVRGTGPAPKEPDKGSEKTGGLSGLKGLGAGVTGGPTGGPSGGSTAGAGGGQLDSTQVQQTVSRYTGSVKRSCWQPALDTRAKDAPTSARVAVTITVSPSGSVQNVSTSGDPKGYRGLASCIAGRVRGWQFPASSGTTTVNVPFYFAAQ